MLSDQMAAVIALLGGAGSSGAGMYSPGAAAAADALDVDGLCAGAGTGPEGIVLGWERTSAGSRGGRVHSRPGARPQLRGRGGAGACRGPLRCRSPLAGVHPRRVGAGVRAVFAPPPQIGAISVGTLLAHRDAPGSLGGGRLRDALALADTLTVLLLRRATDAPARAFAENGDTDGDEGPRPGWARPATHRVEVHQGTGMLSVQLG